MGPQLAPTERTDRRVQEEGPSANAQRLPSVIEFGREICGELAVAENREWIVTNGIGGFASGTVAGLPTRRYHGLLVAALNPPLGRTLLVSKKQRNAVAESTN
jgi:hypothetical protein